MGCIQYWSFVNSLLPERFVLFSLHNFAKIVHQSGRSGMYGWVLSQPMDDCLIIPPIKVRANRELTCTALTNYCPVYKDGIVAKLRNCLNHTAGANYSSALDKIHFQRPLVADDVILLNQPWNDLFKRKQTHSRCSLYILNLPVGPSQCPFQYPSTQTTLSKDDFFTSN